MKSKSSRPNQNNFNKSIVVEGLKKDKLELEALRDQLKRFFDHDYKRNFILFPPIVKRPKWHNRHAY